MLAFLQALFADSRCIIVPICCIKIPLIDSFIAPFTIHIFEIVHLLALIRDHFTFFAAEDIEVSYLVNFLLALGAGVFHIDDPLLNAMVAVFVIARI